MFWWLLVPSSPDRCAHPIRMQLSPTHQWRSSPCMHRKCFSYSSGAQAKMFLHNSSNGKHKPRHKQPVCATTATTAAGSRPTTGSLPIFATIRIVTTRLRPSSLAWFLQFLLSFRFLFVVFVLYVCACYFLFSFFFFCMVGLRFTFSFVGSTCAGFGASRFHTKMTFDFLDFHSTFQSVVLALNLREYQEMPFAWLALEAVPINWGV